MHASSKIICPAVLSLLMPCAVTGQIKGMFSEPGSTLLFGSPYSYIALANENQNILVQNPPGFIGQGSSPLPALALAGDRAAWGMALPRDPSKTQCRDKNDGPCLLKQLNNWHSVLGVYSQRSGSWSLYGNFCLNEIGSVAFSPDGNRVVFSAKPYSDGPACHSERSLLQVLDLATGQMTPIPYSGSIANYDRISWSPDGKYVAGVAWAYSRKSVVVINVNSGDGEIIAEGDNPSLSPNGDWIAFIDTTREKCILVHADGSGSKVVLDQSKGTGRPLLYGAVWSPDGSKLLFNQGYGILESKNSVTMLDLTTGKTATKSKKGPYILGWVQQTNH
jgi:hypothetical protein